MTEGDVLDNGHGLQWRLLLGFAAPDGSASEQEPVEQVTAALRELGLPCLDVDRIGRAISERLRKARHRAEADQQNVAILIRLWTLNPSAGRDLRSGAEVQREGEKKHRGWGFFLLERQEAASGAGQVESPHLLELYLYEESSGAK